MKKSIKSIIAAVMSACVALSGSACYAVKGGKKRSHRIGGVACGELAGSACREEDPAEGQLRELQSMVENLIRAGGDFNSSPELCSKFIPLENSDALIGEFSKFFTSFIKSKGSLTSLKEGIVLFLSIVRCFGDGLSRPPEPNLYWVLALVTLDMCTMRNEAMYKRWYEPLLKPYATLELSKIEKDFSGQRKNLKRSVFRLIGHQTSDELRKMFIVFDGKITEIQKGKLLRLILPEIHPTLDVLTKAMTAVRKLGAMTSLEDIDSTEKVLTKCVDELSCARKQKEYSDELIRSCERKVEEMLNQMKAVRSRVTLLNEELPRKESIVQGQVRAMLAEKSPESIVRAESAYRDYAQLVLQSIGYCAEQRILINMKDKSRCFCDAITWAKNYVSHINPRRIAADNAIRALSAELSEKSLSAASEAQNAFKDVLDEYDPEVNDLASRLDMLFKGAPGKLASSEYSSKILEDFKSMQENLKKNYDTIAKLKKSHEALLAAMRCGSERRQRLEEWKAKVTAGREAKEEEKRCKTERSESPKEVEPHDVVFFHNPETSNPLKFLEDNPQHLGEWHNWFKAAKDGKFLAANIMRRDSSCPIFDNQTGRDLNICTTDGRVDIREYRGGGALKNTPQGLRIVYYVEKDTNCVVVLYVGQPFGESHGNLWKTLIMTPKWVYEHIGDDGVVTGDTYL